MTDPTRPAGYDPTAAPAEETTSSYTPPPTRDRWTPDAAGWGAATPRAPDWFEPVAPRMVPTVTTLQAPGAQPRRREPRRGPIAFAVSMFAIALLAAGLASLGTYVALEATGRLDPRVSAAPAAAVPISSTESSPSAPAAPRVDEQSAVTAAAEKISPAIVTISTRGGKGSGIIYEAGGLILTNRHVVSGAQTLSVALKDGRTFRGRVYGTDTLTDLAIVKVDASDLPVAAVGDSKGLKPGQLAIAIGSPLGEFTNSVTTGVVSALNRSVDVNDEATGGARRLRNLIQTDAAINPGNSGGALVDASGQVIGVNTAVAGNGAQGIGFAIPINIAKPIMEQAVAGEQLARPYIGISYREVTPALMDEKDLPIDYGVWLGRDEGDPQPTVVEGSPADRAGLEEGDIITSVNGQRIDATNSLDEVLTAFEPGQELVLTVLRDGKTLDLNVTLGTRPAAT
jgi:S1-C subfamily serine protease